MSDHIEQRGPRGQGDDCIDIIVDGDKGDFTVRPCRPSLRALLEAERAELIRRGLIKLPDSPEEKP